MALDNESLVFNLDKNFNIFNLNAKQFDTSNARSFTFCLVQDGAPFDLTGVSVKVGGLKPDRTKFFNDVVIVDNTKGIINLTLTGQMLAIEGIISLEFLFFKNDIRLSSYPFEINVVPSVTDFAAIQSSDEFGALTNALSKVDNTLTDVENKVNGAVNDLKSNNIGVTNLLANSGQMVDLSGWWLNKANNSNAVIELDSGYNKTTNGIKATCTNAGDWCVLQSGVLNGNNFYFIQGESYTISGLLWVNDPTQYRSIPIAIGDGNGQNQIFGANIIFNSENIEYGDSHYSKFSFTFKAPNGGNENQLKITLNTGIQIYLAYIKLERGVVATDWNYSIYDIKNMKNTMLSNLNNINNTNDNLQKLREKQEKDITWTNGNVTYNSKQIVSNSNAIADIQHNWFSDCSNSLCINGFTSLKLYSQGVYYITGDAVTELQSIDHSDIKNGQSVHFICETNSNVANIKFPASLRNSGVYTPKGADFWITGRDNGDVVYTMIKIGGAMRLQG